MDLIGGAAGGDGSPPHRGFCVPDLREELGLISKSKGRSKQGVSGNPNLAENMTLEDIEELFFDFLRSNGVGEQELNKVFEPPVLNQGDEADALNRRSGGIYYRWSGSRREYFFLQLKGLKHLTAQIAGDMKSIKEAIELMKAEVEKIHKEVIALGGIPYRIPDQLLATMEIPKAERKSNKRRK